MPMAARSVERESSRTSTPSRNTVAGGGSIRRGNTDSSVVLPLPVAPTIATVCPGSTTRSTSRRTGRPPKLNVRWRSSRRPATLRHVERHRRCRVRDGRRHVEQFEHALPRRGAALQHVGDPAKGDHRPRQHHQIRVERDQLTDRDATGNHLATPQPEHQQRTQAEQQRQAGVERPLQANQPAVARDVLLVGLAELREFGALLAVRPHDSHARQVLLRHGAQLGELLLDALEPPVDRRAEDLDRHRDKRQRQQRDHRQPRIDRDHQDDGDDEHERGLGRIHHRWPGHHADGVEVVGRTRHQVAGPAFLVERRRQALQVPEEIVAEVVLHVPRDADDDLPHEEPEDSRRPARWQTAPPRSRGAWPWSRLMVRSSTANFRTHGPSSWIAVVARMQPNPMASERR